MVERHQTRTAIFGGKPGEQLQYKGMFPYHDSYELKLNQLS